MKQRYDSYKPSGIDWIGDIPSHWTVMPVKYVLDNLDYLRQPISAEDRERNNPQYDYYGASGVIDQIDYYNVEDTVLLIGEDGANLVMRNLPLIYKASGKFWVNNHAHILKPQNGYDYSYLAHLLEAGDYTLFITGSAQPKLSQENLNKYPICIPPLAEQEAIAAWLDEKCGEIDAAIAKVDREIELIDELKQSEISRVVTRGLNSDAPLRPSGIDWIGDIPKHWIICKVKHLVKFNSGDTITSEQFIDNAEFPVYGANGYRGQFDKYNFENQRILIGRVGALCGNVHYTNEKIWCSEHALISSKAFGGLSFDYKWMCLLFESMNLNQYGGGSAQPVIASSVIENLSIILPPLSEQQAIADYLDKKCTEIDGLKAKSSKKRETLKELRQSIISEVVTGKRKVI